MADTTTIADAMLREFEQTWSEGRLAEMARRLPSKSDPTRLPTLLGLIRIDLRERWRRGRPTHIEHYLAQHPELGNTESAPRELIQAELEARLQAGDTSASADLAKRFPRQWRELFPTAGTPITTQDTNYWSISDEALTRVLKRPEATPLPPNKAAGTAPMPRRRRWLWLPGLLMLFPFVGLITAVTLLWPKTAAGPDEPRQEPVRHQDPKPEHAWKIQAFFPERSFPKSFPRVDKDFAFEKAGDEAIGEFEVPGLERYKFQLWLAKGPDYGQIEVFVDEVRLEVIDAYRRAVFKEEATDLGLHLLQGGKHTLRLKVAGKNAQANGFRVGFVALHVLPQSRRIGTWNIIGVWPCAKERGWKAVQPPEVDHDLKKSYQLKDGETLTWQEFNNETVHFQLKDGYPGQGKDWSVGYGLTWVKSSDARVVPCFLGRDDSLKVWVNGEVVFENETWSPLYPDAHQCAVTLREGWNKILVKNANHDGVFGYSMRLGDPKGELTYSFDPPPK